MKFWNSLRFELSECYRMWGICSLIGLNSCMSWKSTRTDLLKYCAANYECFCNLWWLNFYVWFSLSFLNFIFRCRNIRTIWIGCCFFVVAMEDTNSSELFIVGEAPTFFSTLIVLACLFSFTHSSVCVLTVTTDLC